MIRPYPLEFGQGYAVDLVTRRVTHSEGAAVVFPSYEDEANWLASDSVSASRTRKSASGLRPTAIGSC